jgi:hypothetical protein
MVRMPLNSLPLLLCIASFTPQHHEHFHSRYALTPPDPTPACGGIDVDAAAAPGEFALMNYRTTHGFKPPFLVITTVEPDMNSDHKVRRLHDTHAMLLASCAAMRCRWQWARVSLLRGAW